MSTEETWYQHLANLIDYLNTYKKRPSQLSKNDKERHLAYWYLDQLQNRIRLEYIMKNNEDVRKQWDKFVIDYKEYFLSSEQIWNTYLDKLINYINVNKEQPSESSKDKPTKQLAIWRRTQQINRKNMKQAMKVESIRNKWDKFTTDYKEYLLSLGDYWNANLALLIDYIKKNKIRPLHHSHDEETRRLARWCTDNLSNYKKNIKSMKIPEQRAKFEKLLKDYPDIFDIDKIQQEMVK